MASANLTVTVQMRRRWCFALGCRLLAFGYWLMHRPQWKVSGGEWRPMYRLKLSLGSERGDL